MVTGKNTDFRLDLQGLRAIAILLVVIAHADLMIFPGGFVGVDVFFVLSGYLITRLLFRELESNTRIDFLRFYARRLKRLFPALMSMLVVIGVLAYFLLSPKEILAQIASAPYAVTWTSNIYFAFSSLDYFDELSDKDLFLHTWSLGVEEQFYLLWPVLLFVLFKFRVSWNSAEYKSYGVMLSGLALICLASFLLSLYWLKYSPQVAFYFMPSRIWQLSLGAIVFFIFQGRLVSTGNFTGRSNYRVANLLLYFGLVIIIGSGLGLDTDLEYPGLWALIPSIGAALVIAAGHYAAQLNNPLSHPVMVWLGDRSYSLYLWHWPILMLGFSLGYQGQIIPTLLLLLLSLLIATVSFQWIELPFWKGNLLIGRPLQNILVTLMFMALTVHFFQQGLLELTNRNLSTGRAIKYQIDTPIIYKQKCDSAYTNATVKPCIFSTGSPMKTVVLFGDSIGVQWFSMLAAIFPQPEWKTIVLTKSACPMVDEEYFNKRIGKIFTVCEEWRNAALDEFDRLQPDVLIMGSSSTYKFTKHQWIEGTSRILERVSRAAEFVYLIPGTPGLGFDGPSCLYRNTLPTGEVDHQACKSNTGIMIANTISNYLVQSTDRFENVYLLDLNDLVCPGNTCQALSNSGLAVYRDSRHLNDIFVRSLSLLISERIFRTYTDVN